MVFLAPFFYLFVEVCIFLPPYLLGILAFPIAYHFAALKIEPSFINKGEYVIAFRNRVLNEWLGNREDGLLPGWWQKERAGTAYGWFLRNPVSNMRFWPHISTLPSPETKWIGTLAGVPGNGETGWFIAWHGVYAGWLWQTKKFGVWLGWKVTPPDRFIGTPFPPAKDYRYYGLGTACMIWRVK